MIIILFSNLNAGSSFETKAWVERIVIVGVSKPPTAVELTGTGKITHHQVLFIGKVVDWILICWYFVFNRHSASFINVHI